MNQNFLGQISCPLGASTRLILRILVVLHFSFYTSFVVTVKADAQTNKVANLLGSDLTACLDGLNVKITKTDKKSGETKTIGSGKVLQVKKTGEITVLMNKAKSPAGVKDEFKDKVILKDGTKVSCSVLAITNDYVKANTTNGVKKFKMSDVTEVKSIRLWKTNLFQSIRGTTKRVFCNTTFVTSNPTLGSESSQPTGASNIPDIKIPIDDWLKKEEFNRYKEMFEISEEIRRKNMVDPHMGGVRKTH